MQNNKKAIILLLKIYRFLFRSCLFFYDITSGIFIYGMLVAELLALLRTALDSESSDGEEIYPLFTQSRRDSDSEQP